jgi:hypothetical protein
MRGLLLEDRDHHRHKCRGCGHSWMGYYSPAAGAPIGQASQDSVGCPKCGSSSIVSAPTSDAGGVGSPAVSPP